MHDIDKTKEQLISELAELRLSQFSVDRAADAIFWIDCDGKFLYVNDQACRSLGYSREELLSMTVRDIGQKFPAETWPAHWKDLKQRGSFSFESTHRRKDGTKFPVEVTVNYLHFFGLEYNCAFARDITERKAVEGYLAKEKYFSEMIIESLPNIFYLMDDKGKFHVWNKNAEIITGYSAEEIKRMDVMDFFLGEDKGLIADKMQEVFDKGEANTEADLITKDGRKIRHVITGKRLIVENKQYIAGVCVDITERKRTEKELNKFKFISDNANDAHFLVERDGKFRYVNTTACRMLGYSEDELLTLGVPDVDMVYGMERFRELFDLVQGESVPPIQSVQRRKDGTTFCSEISITGYNIDGSPCMFAVLRDITERKEAEEKLLASLKEKELLMKEINHRVKNNLAVVSSLIRLQAAKVEDKRYRAMFNESIGRIHTISSIHEKLYRSEEVSKIIFSDYIKDTVINVFRTYEPGPRIKLRTDIEKITLGIDASVPCGLIVNELVTNSLKHAFPEDSDGEITVSFHKNDKGEVELTVGDNGSGMPEGLDQRNSNSLGLTIVNALVSQLRGNMQISRENGTYFTVTFKA